MNYFQEKYDLMSDDRDKRIYDPKTQAFKSLKHVTFKQNTMAEKQIDLFAESTLVENAYVQKYLVDSTVLLIVYLFYRFLK